MGFCFRQGDRPLAGYTIDRAVGRGGFGEVYYATSDGGKEVALKYLRDNPQVELRGVAHCLNLKSPHLVAVHDVKQNPDGDYFVVMEYIAGPSLRDLMNAEPDGLGPQKAAYFLRELGKGLAYLHDRGIVHRDLKPGNIFYEDGYVKIGDYGLSKFMAASQHSGQTVSVGTVHYMAPEVGSGNYDRTIDIYALGVILYEMLLGHVPFTGATMGEVLMKHLTAQPEVDDLPEPFPKVIRKALQKDPKDRYQTVQEMVAEVFAVEDLDRSVAAFEPASISQAAAQAAKQAAVALAGVGAAQHTPGPLGTGSSNIGLGPPPPPVIDPGVTVTGAGGRFGRRRSFTANPQAEKTGDKLPRGFVKDGWFPQKTRLTTGLLGLLLGPVGAHRFYTGFTGIGIAQIVVTCTTGFGAFWGFIEGIRILAGFDYRDSLGRPLLERKSKGAADPAGAMIGRLGEFAEQIRDRLGQSGAASSESSRRGVIARTTWVVSAVVSFLGASCLAAAGMFAPPAWEQAGVGLGPAHYVNLAHLGYVFAPPVLAFGVFSVWKASHRGGLTTWRRTIRPGLLCTLSAIGGAALVFEVCFLAGRAQLGGIVVTLFATIAFLVVWLLRGPEPPRQVHDAYWNRALARVFMASSTLTLGGMAAMLALFFQQETTFTRPGPATKAISVSISSYERVPETTRWEEVRHQTEYDVPAVQYNHAPVAAILLGVLGVGSLDEARYRRRCAGPKQTSNSVDERQ